MPRIILRENETIDSFIERVFNDWYHCVKHQIKTTYSHARFEYYKFLKHYEQQTPRKYKTPVEKYYEDLTLEFDKIYYQKYKK